MKSQYWRELSAICGSPVKNCPQHIPELAKIWYMVLGSVWFPDIPMNYVEQRFHDHLSSDVLPITFVALDGNTSAGMCSLRKNDGIRPDLTPWLASLVVSPTYQKRGIGGALMQAAQQKATAMGFEHLYLFTLDSTIPDWYAHMGWKQIGMDTFKGYQVTVMEFDLCPQK